MIEALELVLVPGCFNGLIDYFATELSGFGGMREGVKEGSPVFALVGVGSVFPSLEGFLGPLAKVAFGIQDAHGLDEPGEALSAGAAEAHEVVDIVKAFGDLIAFAFGGGAFGFFDEAFVDESIEVGADLVGLAAQGRLDITYGHGVPMAGDVIENTAFLSFELFDPVFEVRGAVFEKTVEVALSGASASFL